MNLTHRTIVAGGALLLLPFFFSFSQSVPFETVNGRFLAGAANFLLMEDQGREVVVRVEKNSSLKGWGAIKELEKGDNLKVTYKKKARSVIYAETIEADPVIHSDGSVMAELSSVSTPSTGNMIILDARSSEDYDFAHILGALHAEVYLRQGLPGDVPLIVYGENARDERPFSFLRLLVGSGHKNVRVLQGGISVYKTLRIPLESAPGAEATSRFPVILDIRGNAEFVRERVKGAELFDPDGKGLDSHNSPFGTPDILVYGDEKDESRAIALARRIFAMKYDQDIVQDGIVAYAKGGFKALKKAGAATESGDRKNPASVVKCSYYMPREKFEGEIAARPENFILIDVRAGAGPVPGNAIAVPLEDFPEKGLQAIPAGKRVVVFCDRGIRARIAARIIIDNGYDAHFLDGLP